jgi:hypothetical protein
MNFTQHTNHRNTSSGARRGRHVWRAALVLAVGVAPAILGLSSAGAGVASYTSVTGGPNPSLWNQSVKVTATQCVKGGGYHPTGAIKLTDLYDGKVYGTLAITPTLAPECSSVSRLLTGLVGGQVHKIQALYIPGGTKPAPASPAAAYRQKVLDHTVTHIKGTPNPAPPASPITIVGQECDLTTTVQPTGTMTFRDLTTGIVLGTVPMMPSIFSNCGEAHITPNLGTGIHTISATYQPGGAIPVPASPAATYQQEVQ